MNNPYADTGPGEDKEFKRSLNTAYKFLSYQPRSVFEMTGYLEKKKLDQRLIDRIIQHLKDSRYLDDHDFAERYIRSRVDRSPKSKFAMGYELKQKGVNSSVFEPLLTAYDDLELALAAIGKKTDQWRRLSPEAHKKKVINYLKYRGFSYTICCQVLDRLTL